MHGRLKPLNDLTRRHSSGKNRPGAVHGSSQHSVTNTSNISAQARQFRPRRVHKLGFMKRILLGTLALSIALMIVGPLFFVGHTQALPAPTVDRVGFPTGYQDTYTLFY